VARRHLHLRSGRRGPVHPGRQPRLILAALGLAVAACIVLVAVVPLLSRIGSGAGGAVFRVGVTHTEHSADGFNPHDAVDRAKAVLREVAPVQNQNLMGWGARNPEPSPGVFDFGTLDDRIHLITGTGGEPVLTLCCAPDWMKGGEAGSTDWSRLEVAPTRDHYADFARLAAVAAQRYPEVHHFLVWNELKGFYDAKRGTWDVAAYTDLYNQVYRAVKRVRPDAQIGGPYVVFDSWSSVTAASHPSKVRGPWGVLDQRALDVVDYWLKHAVGADFVAVDGGAWTRDRGAVTTDFATVAKLGAVTRWVRSRTHLPIWWAEIYAESGDAASSADPRSAAVMANALVTVAKAGASVALLWQPEASSDVRSPALFSSTSSQGGGRPLPLVGLLKALEGPLGEDPAAVKTSWDPARSRWSVATHERTFTWSPDQGLSMLKVEPGLPPRPAGSDDSLR
jgi:hypothetical protein